MREAGIMRADLSNLLKATAITAAAICCILGPARAAGAERGCISFKGTSGSLRLELRERYTLSGILPLTLCDIEPGTSYRLLVDGAGMERRIGTFDLSRSGRASFGGIRTEEGVRNAIIPGWGSVYAERSIAGISDGVSLGALILKFLDENGKYKDLEDRYKVLNNRLSESAEAGDGILLERAAHEALLKANVQNKYRRRLAYACAAVYGYQLVDVWLSSPPPRTKIEEEGVIRVGVPPRSRAKALFKSLLRPGRGQLYQGKTKRGFFFSILPIAAGIVALDYDNRYGEAANNYKIAVKRFKTATTIEERGRLANEASNLWGEVESKKRNRNTAYVVLAALWGWNVLDTLFQDGSEASNRDYSLDLGPESVALRIRF